MVRICIVCRVSSKDNIENVSFHLFTKNEIKRHKWCDALGISRATPNQSVCSIHFSPGSYNFSNSRKMLKPFAVPSLCLKKKRIYNTCRIGDFTSFDFGTPKRSSKNLIVGKNIVQNLRRKKQKFKSKK
ncbi:hypothetical protein QTP88_021536 [Uroleucon formosanum]